MEQSITLKGKVLFKLLHQVVHYILSVGDMLSGGAECYLNAFLNVWYEMASILVKAEGVEEKVAQIVVSIKNLMT